MAEGWEGRRVTERSATMEQGVHEEKRTKKKR